MQIARYRMLQKTIFLILIISLLFSFAACGAVNEEKQKQQEEQKISYQAFIQPLVMLDVTPFSSLGDANYEELLGVCIWSLLMNNDTPDRYEADDGMLLVPAADVSEEVLRLFGSNMASEFCSVQGDGYVFEYLESSDVYQIELLAVKAKYTPKILEITKKGGEVVLETAYLTQALQDEQGVVIETEPEKIMEIVLRDNVVSEIRTKK